MTTIKLKRVYDDPAGDERDEGFRVYVDRLWPRGESHEKFHYDLWAKEVAPSRQLREWFHEDPAGRWDEFGRRYDAELDSGTALGSLVEAVAGHAMVTLLYSSRDRARNNAVVLARRLADRLGGRVVTG